MVSSSAVLALASSVKTASVDVKDVENSLTKSAAEVLVFVVSVTVSDVANSTTVLSVGETVVEDVVVELFSPDNKLPDSSEEVKDKETTVVEPKVGLLSVDETIVVSLFGLEVRIVELIPN